MIGRRKDKNKQTATKFKKFKDIKVGQIYEMCDGEIYIVVSKKVGLRYCVKVFFITNIPGFPNHDYFHYTSIREDKLIC